MSETLVLTYHSVDDSGSAISTSSAEFESHLRYLQQSGFQSIALLDAVRLVKGGGMPPSDTVIITFDDGYRNNLTHGVPLLQRYGFTATVFVATGYRARENSWGDQHSSIPSLKMMSDDELKRMRDVGIEIGAHTRTHPHLSRLAESEAEAEMAGSQSDLETILGERVRTFSYPYGDYDDSVRRMASSMFEAAIGNRPGRLRQNSDLFAIDRINACSRLFRSLPLRIAGLASFGGYLATKKVADRLSGKNVAGDKS